MKTNHGFVLLNVEEKQNKDNNKRNDNITKNFIIIKI